MVLNILFLAGGIGIGYLLRGELDRRKSKKAWGTALEEGIKVAEKWVNEFADKLNTSSDDSSIEIEDEDEDENIIDLGFLDETIRL